MGVNLGTSRHQVRIINYCPPPRHAYLRFIMEILHRDLHDSERNKYELEYVLKRRFAYRVHTYR